MIKINEIKKISIEELIELIDFNDYSKESIKNKIELSNLSPSEKEQLLYKLKISYSRINEPLELSMKIYFIFFPYAQNSMLSKNDEYIKQYIKFNYKRKIREYEKYSLIGILLYLSFGAFFSFAKLFNWL